MTTVARRRRRLRQPDLRASDFLQPARVSPRRLRSRARHRSHRPSSRAQSMSARPLAPCARSATCTSSRNARGGALRRVSTRIPAGSSSRSTPVATRALFGLSFGQSKKKYDANEIRKNERECVLQTYGRGETEVMVRGKGCVLVDTEGREFLDFTAGIAVNCLGHSDEGVAKVMAEQARTLTHTSNLFHTEPMSTLARKLTATSFADKVFFCNSGTEANEAALKFSRKYAKTRAQENGKSASEAAFETVSFKNGFHGRTMGALSLTWKEGYRTPFEPLVPGNTFTPYGDLEKAKEVIVKGRTCAVFVEPVQGEGGIYPADAAFLQGLRKLCDEADCLLVYDEGQCGLGRTGRIWGHQIVKDAEPDLLTVAKPLANGLPIGAVLMKEKVAAVMAAGDHGSTFAGGPLVCAVANEVFDRVTSPAFLANVTDRGNELKNSLSDKLKGHPHLVEVRGAGLLVGVQFDVPAAPLVKACRDEGLLTITAGKGDILRLVPPLIVSSAEIQKAVDIISRCAFAELK